MADRTEYQKGYYQKNKEYIKKQRQEYYQNHKEQKREYQQSNRERIQTYHREYNKKYRITHREILNSNVRRYNKIHRKKLKIKERLRQYQLKISGSHTLGEWETLKAQYNWTCPACGKTELEIKLTEDHIIPLSKGGSNNIENIQPLCGPCNSKKSTKIIIYSPEEEISNSPTEE